MTLDLYAGIYVHAAKSWYAQLFGSEPSFIASETEAVWELAGHRPIFIEENAEHAGHAVHSIFLDDVDALVAQIAERGIEPVKGRGAGFGPRRGPL